MKSQQVLRDSHGFWLGSPCRVPSQLGARAEIFTHFRVWGLGFRVWGSRDYVLRAGASLLGFGVQGLMLWRLELMG